MGPRTDADVCQADTPAGGHAVDSTQSGSSTDQPGQVAEAVARPAGMDDSAMQSAGMLGLGLALRPENGGLGLGLGSSGLGLGLDTKALALPISRPRPGSHSITMCLLDCH